MFLASQIGTFFLLLLGYEDVMILYNHLQLCYNCKKIWNLKICQAVSSFWFTCIYKCLLYNLATDKQLSTCRYKSLDWAFKFLCKPVDINYCRRHPFTKAVSYLFETTFIRSKCTDTKKGKNKYIRFNSYFYHLNLTKVCIPRTCLQKKKHSLFECALFKIILCIKNIVIY